MEARNAILRWFSWSIFGSMRMKGGGWMDGWIYLRVAIRNIVKERRGQARVTRVHSLS